jgi:phosphatidylinositol alpha-1,6-mannosyltransferase
VRDCIYREAGIAIAANEFARRNLIRIGILPSKIRKITPGVDFERFKPRDPDSELVDRLRIRGKTVLLTVARLVPRKGHKAVIEALRRLLPEFPNLVYVIVGTGPEEPRLRDLVSEWNVGDAVRFAGFVKDEDLPGFYNACHLFVMPNREEQGSGDIEGFGMVFLEANACGKPVVGGRSGGAAEAVVHGKSGILIDPDNPSELAGSLRQLLRNNDLCLQMGADGFARARSDFDWLSRARLLDDINREMLGAGRGNRAANLL